DLTDAALVATTLAMALRSRRFIPLFVFVATPFLARNLCLVAARIGGRASASARRLWQGAGAAIAAAGSIAIVAALVPQARASFAPGLFAGMTYADRLPSDAVGFLRANQFPGRLYNYFSWGGYLLFWLPEKQVFWDGRAHAVYDAAQW